VTAPVVNASQLTNPSETVAFYTGTYVTNTTPKPPGLSAYCTAYWPSSPLQAFGTNNFPADVAYMSGTNIAWAEGHAKFKKDNGGFQTTSLNGCAPEPSPCPTYHMSCDLTGLPDGRADTWSP
jgi:hypothetical protein